jgi:hypothetical protein
VKTRRPHVVPRGYLRNFADRELLLLIEKRTGVTKAVGTRHAFVASNFLRVRAGGISDDSAEDAFGVLEAFALDRVRHISPREPITPDQDAAVKALAAMLFARSFATEAVRQRLIPQVVAEQRDRVGSEPDAVALFRRDFGRPPRPGELETLVEAVADANFSTRRDAVDGMIRHYGWALENLKPMAVSVYQATGAEFVTSDNPLVLVGENRLHVGVHNGVAFKMAATIFLPLTRRIAVCFTPEPIPNETMNRRQVRAANNFSWRNAVARVACHPALDWSDACGVAMPGRP